MSEDAHKEQYSLCPEGLCHNDSGWLPCKHAKAKGQDASWVAEEAAAGLANLATLLVPRAMRTDQDLFHLRMMVNDIHAMLSAFFQVATMGCEHSDKTCHQAGRFPPCRPCLLRLLRDATMEVSG